MKILFSFVILVFVECLTDASKTATPPTLIKCSNAVGNISETIVFNTSSGELLKFGITENIIGDNMQMQCLEKDTFKLEINATSNLGVEFNLNSDGSLEKTENGMSYIRQPSEYCVHSVSETNIVLRVCKLKCPGNVECLQKCCGRHQVLGYNSKNNLVCQYKEKEPNWRWNSTTFKDFYTNLMVTEENSSVQPHYIMGILKESGSYRLYTQPQPQYTGSYHKSITLSNFHIINDGGVGFCKGVLWNLYELGYENFCFDLIQNFGTTNSSLISPTYALVVDSALDDLHGTFMKLPEETKQALESFQIIFYIFIPLCAFFLLLVVLVHCLLWDKQNIHGWTIVCYCITLFLHYVTWISIPLEDMLETQNDKIMNNVNTFFSYSTICWLTAVNFDIWITFRKVRLSKTNSYRRFSMYAAFSWIIPLLAVLIGVLVTYYRHRGDSETCPKVDSKELPPVLTRFMQSIFQRFLFFSALLGCNFLFFLHTVYKMYRQNKKSNNVLQSTTNYLGNILIKLSVVMGGCWLLDTIPLILLFYIFWRGEDHYAINVGKDLTRFLNKAIVCAWMSEGVTVFESIAIFYIFCCKRKIYNQLREKYKVFRNIPTFSTQPGTGETALSSRYSRSQSQNPISLRDPSCYN